MDSSDPTADPVDEDGSSSSASEEKSVAASKDVSSIVSTRSAVQSEPARLIVDDKSTWEGVVIDDHATAAVTRKQKRSGLPFSIFIKARQVRMLDLGPYSVGEKYRARVFGTSVDVSFRDPSSLNVLRRELRTLSSLHHPSILIAFGLVKIQPGLAMITEQYACSVESVLQDGPIRFNHGIRIAYQIASALAYMHTHRLYHGAVRAANVVLKERTHTDPSAKLSMFSECRFAEETSSRLKLGKQDKLDYNVFFLAVVFSDRSAQTHGFGTNHASKTKSDHQEAAAEIFSALIRSPFQDAAIFCEHAEKLSALDAEIRRACDGLEQLFISGDRDPDPVI